MKTFLYPPEKDWEQICLRPETGRSGLEETVREILISVRSNGDRAIMDFSEKFDGVSIDSLKVSEADIAAAAAQVPENLKAAIKVASANISKFHETQITKEEKINTSKGVTCWRKNVPVEKAGLYIPGGSAPLFSTVLMLGIPARIAGCGKVIMCTPPSKDGKVDPAILYTASSIGINEIYKAGGAQAIAAMAYGTETIPRVYKIFGPGNQYVTKAKELIQLDGISIDMPAGPSEVLVIGDGQADPEFIASDLLSQAEHGPDSQVIMVTDNCNLVENVKEAVDSQVKLLPRQNIALKALDNSKLILLYSIDECISFSNIYAPEHLIINISDPDSVTGRIINAGSVFLGRFSCESAGDYATGTNHTLPTNGFAKSCSGVSVESFMKKISFQKVTEEGIKDLGPVIEVMASAEKLLAHKNAVSLRLKKLNNG